MAINLRDKLPGELFGAATENKGGLITDGIERKHRVSRNNAQIIIRNQGFIWVRQKF